MKIEKISENQIRCTLTQADLAERQLRLSELAYGTEKAKSLFQDMMKQAALQFGFEADNIPLMIEAIPTSSDSIILNITKVQDPEELDTRFSKFGPSADSANNNPAATPNKLEGAESLLDLLGKMREKFDEAAQKQDSPKEAETLPAKNSSPLRLFSFSSLDHVILAAKLLAHLYYGPNTLYKDSQEDVYILMLTQSAYTQNEFSRICNMLTEYGSLEPSNGATLAFLEEHCETIIKEQAIAQLSQMNI